MRRETKTHGDKKLLTSKKGERKMREEEEQGKGKEGDEEGKKWWRKDKIFF